MRTSPNRRALLVGIAVYDPRGPNGETSGPRKPAGSLGRRPAHSTPARTFENLLGPGNDVELMRQVLTAKYAFTEVTLLRDQQATRSAIAQAIKSHLIDRAAPGDICMFYYSGHGSRVRNSKDPKGYDESIVPADSMRGAADIRDKELARLFLKAIEKGIALTAIFDSCHSGSIARGLPRTEERARFVPIDERDVADTPDFVDSPEDSGALVLSAAKDEQLAYETNQGKVVHGNFTWALTTVLTQPAIYANESASRVFDRVVSLMKGRGFSERPVLGGTHGRRREPLFGHSSDHRTGAPTAAVVSVTGGEVVRLKGGLAMGLSVGCELIPLEPRQSQNPPRLRVTRVTGLDSCDCSVIEGEEGGHSVAPGMLFVMDRWIAPHRTNLKVYIPPAITEPGLARINRDITTLRQARRLKLVDDPTREAPNFVLHYGQRGWGLSRFNGPIETLGPLPGAKRLSERIPVGDTLFVNIPPSFELRQKLELGKGTRRELIDVSESPVNVQYVLAGRLADHGVEYSWVRPGVMAEDLVKDDAVLPARTDWIKLGEASTAILECAKGLGERAVNLGKISGWLQIQAPADESTFPYKLALRRVGNGTQIGTERGYETRCAQLPPPSAESRWVREGTVNQGECYDLVLVADQRFLDDLRRRGAGVKRQWIYVFAMDSEGRSVLLFPTRGVVENYLPFRSGDPPTLMTVNRPNARVWYQEPFGLDAYILLASDEELTNPDVLEFDGVVSRGKGGIQHLRP